MWAYPTEVSDELGIAQSVNSRLWQRFQDDGNVSRRYSTGFPSVTTPNEDRYLAVTAKRNRLTTALVLPRQLSSATGTTISRRNVYRRLGQIDLYARRLFRCVSLTATHCRLRLAWSREHALWTPQQWACVMFSDESRFSLQSDSRRTFIWRATDTRYHQENIIEGHRYGGAGIILAPDQICIKFDSIICYSACLVVVRAVFHRLLDIQYINHLMSSFCKGLFFVIAPGNKNRKCLRSEDITRMDWPAFSPDLNSVEHVWDMLSRRVAARQPPPTGLPELRRALLFEWNLADEIPGVRKALAARKQDGFREEPGSSFWAMGILGC
ncbi:Transposable element Tc1 transposase, partial [Stegodyphus mimosarum]